MGMVGLRLIIQGYMTEMIFTWPEGSEGQTVCTIFRSDVFVWYGG